jgi:DNA-binding MarR family transcriptional regulator
VTAWSVRRRASTRDERAGDARPSKNAGPAHSHEFAIDESLGYLVNRVARSMANQLAERMRPAGIGIGQWAVLLFLFASDGMSQAELSRDVAIEPPTMVRTIDRLVRDGLVTRVPDPLDGRVSRIHLTDRGRSLRDELIPMAVAVNEATLARLTEGEGKTLRRILTKLVAT